MNKGPLSAEDRLKRAIELCASVADELRQVGPVAEALDLRDAAILARHLLRLRDRRNLLFPTGLFADPSWDMLLDLLVAESEGRRVAVSSLCIASGAPATTALRWIARLAELKLIERSPDTHDGRRSHVALTESASLQIRSLLASF
jgi:DNA-binding MarR family transcriptional regulator